MSRECLESVFRERLILSLIHIYGAADTVAGVSIQIILEHGVEFVDQAAGFLLPLGAADTVLTAQQDNICLLYTSRCV